MKSQTPALVIACLSAALVSIACAPRQVGPTNIERTMQFVAAYNEQDVQAMIAMVTEDVRWMSVAGASINIEASGRSVLEAGMENYFLQKNPSPSRMRSLVSSGNYVLGVEEVTRRAGDDRPGQCSAVIYEFQDTLIRDVWYFPAHAC